MAVALICHFCSVVSLLLSGLGAQRNKIVLGCSSQQRGQQLYKWKISLLHTFIKVHCSFSVHAKAFVRFLQSIPKIAWMCKKTGKVQGKATYCMLTLEKIEDNREAEFTGRFQCHIVLSPPAFLESKAGTELLPHCADGRPRNLAPQLNQSHIPLSQVWVPLRICSAHPGFAVTSDERTAGQQNSWPPSVQRWNCSLQSLKASCNTYSTEGLTWEW